MSLISIVIPTISGREDLLAMCTRDYQELTEMFDVEIIVIHDAPNCGTAWQMGAEEAKGDYLHLTADDIEPLKGWEAAAVACVEDWNAVPAARVWRPDGPLESGVRWGENGWHGQPAQLAQIPFCSMHQWEHIGPMVPLQYYSDNWFTWRAEQYGWPCRLAGGYEFIHHRPRDPRPGEREQTIRDGVEYKRYQERGWA